MKEYKNIDELVDKAADGFHIQPSNQVWANLEHEIVGKGIANNNSYIRWILAAIFILLLGPSLYWINNEYFAIDEEINSVEMISNADQKEDKTAIINDKNIEASIIETNNKPEEEVIEIIEAYPQIENKILMTVDNNQTNTNNNIQETEIEEYVFGLNDDENNESYGFQYIETITSRTIYEITYMDTEHFDKKISIEELVEKRKKQHTYSGLAIKPAMIYYPNTRDQFTYTAEANFGIIFNKFYIETGVAYQHMKESGIYKYNFKSKDSIGFYNRVESFEIDPLNPNNITYKTSQTTVYDSVEHYDLRSPMFSYAYLNIPLKVGYRVWKKDNISLGLETGLIFSKLIGSEIPKSEFDYPEYSLLSIEDETPTRVDLNLQLIVALRFNYNISNSISVSAQPEFTKYLNSIYDTEIGDPNTKPYTMGLKFGIYYDF